MPKESLVPGYQQAGSMGLKSTSIVFSVTRAPDAPGTRSGPQVPLNVWLCPSSMSSGFALAFLHFPSGVMRLRSRLSGRESVGNGVGILRQSPLVRVLVTIGAIEEVDEAAGLIFEVLYPVPDERRDQ